MYFDFYLPKVTVSCEICPSDCTSTTADHRSTSTTSLIPWGSGCLLLKATWRLKLVHPLRGEWPTVIPKLGKNAKIWPAFAKCFVALQSHKWKRSAYPKYFPASRSLCIASNCQASYYCSVHVGKCLISPVLTGSGLGKSHDWNSICS